MAFTKATKTRSRLRMALIGPSGSGKTYSALALATQLSQARVAVIDTERGSASKYADLFDFDVLEPETFSPRQYVNAILEAERAGSYDVLVIDSLSHAWAGKGGALEMVDNASRGEGGKFGAWRSVTPEHNLMVDTLIRSPLHVIATMRSKTEYVMEGKTVRKVGLQPVQRDGMEYEFDIVGDMDDATLTIGKTRIPALKGTTIYQPGAELAATLRTWLDSGIADPRLELIAELRAVRAQARELQVEVSPLNQAQVQAMSIADLQAEIASTRQRLAA
jgi:hypothetical protein